MDWRDCDSKGLRQITGTDIYVSDPSYAEGKRANYKGYAVGKFNLLMPEPNKWDWVAQPFDTLEDAKAVGIIKAAMQKENT